MARVRSLLLIFMLMPTAIEVRGKNNCWCGVVSSPARWDETCEDTTPHLNLQKPQAETRCNENYRRSVWVF